MSMLLSSVVWLMSRGLSFLIGGQPVPGKAQRDPRVDVLRGLALLMIFINHIPANPLSAYTLASWGVADAADLFVLLAGFSAAMAYGPGIDREGLFKGARPVLRRVAKLYAVQALLMAAITLLIVFAMTQFGNPLYAETVNIWPMLNDPLRALGLAGILVYQPFFLDILPLYIVLLGAFPLLYLVARRSPGLVLLASLGLWAAARAYGLNLPSAPGHGGWFFNPFAWQLIFVIGIVASLWVRTNGLWQPGRLIAGLGAAIVVAGFITRSPWSEVWLIASLPALPEALMAGFDKTHLGFERVVYALGVVMLMWRLMVTDASKQGLVSQLLAMMGRHSLPVFAMATVLSLASYVAVVESGSGLLGFIAVSVVGTMVLIGFGSFLDWRSQKSRLVVRAATTSQAAVA
ncbi:MAG: OpgC family protein [Bosea sp. (in: a-proteobacteria)]